jgi:hypothetical protein
MDGQVLDDVADGDVMPSPVRILDRGGLLLALLIVIPLGLKVTATSSPTTPPRPVQWSIQYSPAAEPVEGAHAAEAATGESVLAHFATGVSQQFGASVAPPAGTQEEEGHVTSALPAGYIPGTSPSADLAAVLRQSEQRNAGAPPPASRLGTVALIRNPNVRFTRQSQVTDLVSGLVDPRVVDLLTWIAGRRQITITSMRTDHSTCVAGSSPCRVSAHHLGRAFDIGAVNGQICTGIPGAECGRLYEDVVNSLRGTQYQPSQVIYGYDPWPDERWNFELGNHHDHIHIGF